MFTMRALVLQHVLTSLPARREAVGYINPIHYDQVRIRIFGLVVNSTETHRAETTTIVQASQVFPRESMDISLLFSHA